MNPEIQTLAAIGCRFVRLARGKKRPVGAAWQTRSTGSPEDVAAWLRAGANVGLLLGPASGVVDVEFDEWPGMEELAAFGLTDIPTPTWNSSRGQHRLYKWEPWMPQAAVVKLGMLEIRLGGRAAQSVLPPSRHPDGTVYEWIVSPQDVAVAAFPAQLLAKEAVA